MNLLLRLRALLVDALDERIARERARIREACLPRCERIREQYGSHMPTFAKAPAACDPALAEARTLLVEADQEILERMRQEKARARWAEARVNVRAIGGKQ